MPYVVSFIYQSAKQANIYPGKSRQEMVSGAKVQQSNKRKIVISYSLIGA